MGHLHKSFSKELEQIPVHQLLFAAIFLRFCHYGSFRDYSFFHGLQNWTKLEQCGACLYGHFHGD